MFRLLAKGEDKYFTISLDTCVNKIRVDVDNAALIKQVLWADTAALFNRIDRVSSQPSRINHFLGKERLNPDDMSQFQMLRSGDWTAKFHVSTLNVCL